ncbi:hypothetical protein [Serratia inhibens]
MIPGLRITIAKDFNNPYLEKSATGSLLSLAGNMAIYEMRGVYDRGQNRNHLILNNLNIDDNGLNCDGIEQHNAYTGLIEPEEFTIVTSIYVPENPTQTSQIYSSIAETGSPLSGTRIAITNTGGLTASVGANPRVVIMNCGQGVGGWTTFSFTVTNSGMRLLRMTGQKYEQGYENTIRIPARVPIILGGGYMAPHNIGIKGHIGIFAMYNRSFTEAEQMDLIQKTNAVMKDKGIIVGLNY